MRTLPALLLLVGCGAGPVKAPATPSDPVADEARSLPSPGEFYTPGLERYGDPDGLPATALERRLRSAVSRALAPPPALDCVAREYAARFATDAKDPDPGTVQAFARHCGYWTRPTQALAITALTPEKLVGAMERLPPDRVRGAVAIGAVVHPDGKATAALLASPGRLRVGPLAREGATTLAARALTGGTGVELWADEGVQLELKADPRGDLHAQLPAGTRVLEIARWTGRFRRTLGLVELGPRQTRYEPAPPPQSVRDVGALLAAVNAHREEPLAYVARLAAPLNDWLLRLSEAGRASDAPEGLADDRGWPFAELRFGLTAGQDAPQAIGLLAQTPTGRHLLKDPGARQVAFGVRPFAGGIDVVVVALRPFELRDDARDMLLSGLNRARGAQELQPLALDPALSEAAQKAAEAAISGAVPWNDAVKLGMDAVREGKLARGAFGGGGFTAVEPDGADFAKQREALSADMRHVGIGVTAGPLPRRGAPRYVVVFLVAEKLPKPKKPGS